MANTDIYLAGNNYWKAKAEGFFTTYRRNDWKVGTRVDIFEASQMDLGMCGTVVEVSDKEAVVEVW